MAGNSVSPSVVQAFYQAFFSRDPARIAPFLADDVEWIVEGPAGIIPFCGARRGKATVVEMFERLVPNVFSGRAFEPEELVIDGNRVAAFVRISGVQCQTGRTISYCIAQFIRFQDDKIASYRSIVDSFDAAEQWIGHRIEVVPGSDVASADAIAVV